MSARPRFISTGTWIYEEPEGKCKNCGKRKMDHTNEQMMGCFNENLKRSK